MNAKQYRAQRDEARAAMLQMSELLKIATVSELKAWAKVKELEAAASRKVLLPEGAEDQ